MLVIFVSLWFRKGTIAMNGSGVSETNGFFFRVRSALIEFGFGQLLPLLLLLHGRPPPSSRGFLLLCLVLRQGASSGDVDLWRYALCKMLALSRRRREGGRAVPFPLPSIGPVARIILTGLGRAFPPRGHECVTTRARLPPC